MRKSSFHGVIEAIRRERAYQEWPHTIREWHGIMQKELNEAWDSLALGYDEQARQEILHVVSVGVACLQQHGVVERDA